MQSTDYVSDANRRDAFCVADVFPVGQGALELRERVQLHGSKAIIDYQYEAYNFNSAYFIRNYIKCSQYIASIPRSLIETSSTTYDIGGGIGTFLLAIPANYRPRSSIIIDRSEAQSLCARFLTQAAQSRHYSRYLIRNFWDLNLAPGDLRLMCFWACENMSTINSAPPRKTFGKRAILIDYADVIQRVVSLATTSGGRVKHHIKDRVEVPRSLVWCVGQSFVTLNGVVIEYD